ncbi:MAG: hypothetical protein QMC83_09340 [Thermodesulfovibrionales bacterium]|nr:hypothetical protein [Thermodesulfovibrionales bacterium]
MGAVAEYYKIPTGEIKINRKARDIAIYLMYLMKEETDLGLNEIGDEPSGISHTARRLEERLEKDKMLRENLHHIIEILSKIKS